MAVVEENHNERKRARVDSGDSGSNSPESKRVCEDLDEFEVYSPEAKKIRDDLLDILDDADLVSDRETEIQDLESVMKSFEEEILAPPQPEPEMEATLDLGETQPDLGYLLEASDDDLGLPPTGEAKEEEDRSVDLLAISTDASQFEGVTLLGFEDPSYEYDDSFAFGFPGEMPAQGFESGYVTADGFSDPSDAAEFLWRPESLPAL